MEVGYRNNEDFAGFLFVLVDDAVRKFRNQTSPSDDQATEMLWGTQRYVSMSEVLRCEIEVLS